MALDCHNEYLLNLINIIILLTIMDPEIRNVRGHHLVDIADFLYAPKKVISHYSNSGYGKEFVRNQAKIFRDFIDGKTKIKIIAGDLDDICLGNCQNRKKAEIKCNNNLIALQSDGKIAGYFLLEVGKVYSFAQIEKNLRNYYLDQHST